MPTQFEGWQIYIRAGAFGSPIMGNSIQVKYLAGIVGAVLLSVGRSSDNELTPAGQNVHFMQEEPDAKCQLLKTVTGKQSSWLSGQNGDEGSSMCGAANALRNQVVAMGGNVIYGISSPTQNLLSSFVPTDSKMNGQVYRCLNWCVTPLSASAERGMVVR